METVEPTGVADMPIEEVFAMYADWVIQPENITQRNEAGVAYSAQIGSTAISALTFADKILLAIRDNRHDATLQITKNLVEVPVTYSVIMPESPEAFRRAFGSDLRA